MKQLQVQIRGLDCSVCIVAIDMMLEELDGVLNAKTNYAQQRSDISFNPQTISQERILRVMQQAGYDVAIVH